MILQALKEYYDRKAADPESGIAPLGWEWKEIPFLVVINSEGQLVNIEDTRMPDGKKKRAKRFLVPSLGEAKGNGIKANILWENGEYFFGIPMKDSSKKERVREQHDIFVEKVNALLKVKPEDRSLEAVALFLKKFSVEQIKDLSIWNDVISKEAGVNFLFSIVKEGPVTNIPSVRDAINEMRKSSVSGVTKKRCLVTGEFDIPVKLEPNIVGFAATGAHLVSVNNKVTASGNGGATPAFASFMKEQGENSPIGKNASLAYSTALNTLLGKDSRQKISVGDATVVFWTSKDSQFEDEFADVFDDPPKDDPDRLTNSVASLLSAVKTGAYQESGDPTRFHMLGLAPNSARISVRFWHVGTVAEMSTRFAQWFEDLTIAHGPKDKDHLSLFRLLISIASLGKSENIPPNLAGNTMRSILEGLPLPETLLQSTLRRIKAECGEVSYPRAKIIKACLNRKFRFTNPKERMLTVALDKENTNIGYRLGRLFAVLERIQETANPGLNATIRDKYYASASATPAAVFGTLMRLKNHHLSKLTSVGQKINFERQLGEILDGISKFPPHLIMDYQGQFALGYYHQRQDFFTKHTQEEACPTPPNSAEQPDFFSLNN